MSPVDAYPELSTLSEGLRAIFGPGDDLGRVAVVGRQPNPWGGTFPTEIVTCCIDGRADVRLFCKYETGRSAGSHGHRGGVAYEWQVYRDLLQPLSLTVPHYYGSYTDECRGWLWFVLEYLDGSLPVNKARERDAVVRAAGWIGAFHALMENRLKRGVPFSLLRYDRAYYCGWAERTRGHCERHGVGGDWISTVCRAFEEMVDLLLEQPLTVVHGEYYPKNIRWQAGTIRPVDWESTAVGAGEVDVASLTENWPDEITRECEQVYGRTRWPLGMPEEFGRRLDAARLYLQFRWLGSREGWRDHKGAVWRIAEIRRIAERQGLL